MLVIDVYNVLHVGGVLPPELVLHTVRDLAGLIDASRYAGTPRLLVCDGPMQGTGHAGPAATQIGPARVLYSGAGREADDEIEAILRDTSHPTRLIVVSSDKRVIKAARSRRAVSQRSDAFLKHLAEDAARARAEPLPKWVHEIPLDRGSVDHWLATFGLDDAAAAGLGGQGGEGAGGARFTPPVEPPPPPFDPPPAPVEEMTASPSAIPPASARPSVPRPPARREIDEETRRLAAEQGVDADDLDMRRWLGEGGC